MRIDWSSTKVIEWKEEAFQAQHEYNVSLSDRTWDRFYEPEFEHLRSTIAYAVFGCPDEYEETDEELPGYTEQQKSRVIEICDKIVKLSYRHIDNDGVLVAKVFVCIKTSEDEVTLPVFRVCIDSDNDDASFVDSTGRVYKDWNDYLHTNVLPQCLYCYPTNGFYCDKEYGDEDELGKVDVSYNTSPACDFVNKLKVVLDTGGIVVSTLSAGVLVASLFTPLGPILAGVSTAAGIGSGGYGIFRSAEAIIDRSQHEQSISLLDPEARTAWISILGSVVGIAASGATTAMVVSARSGYVFNMAGRIAITAANFGSLTVNGIGIANSLARLIDKVNHDELTALDLYQFSLSVLFFTHGVMNMKTASTIIKQTQKEVLADFEARLDTEDQKAAFQKVASDTRGSRLMHGNGRVIKNLRKIEHFEEFMNSLVHASDGQEHDVKFTSDGKVRINDELEIHADAFQEMTPANKAKAMDATRKFAAKEYNSDQFLNEIKNVCRDERIHFELQRKHNIQSAAKSFGVDDLGQVKINGKAIFENLLPCEIDRLGDVMSGAGKNYDPNLARISLNLAEVQQCTTPMEYCAVLEFSSKYVAKTTKSATLRANQSRSAYRNELEVNLKNTNSEQFKAMHAEYANLKATITAINDASLFQFKCNRAATYHVYKHDGFRNGLVNEQGYYDILNQLFSEKVNKQNVRLTQEGDNIKITYKKPSEGLFGVLIQPRRLKGDAGVHVATMYYDQRSLVRDA